MLRWHELDLAGKLLAVWLAGERGGLRLRFAVPAVFERVPEQISFDDHVAKGKNARASRLLGFRLYWVKLRNFAAQHARRRPCVRH